MRHQGFYTVLINTFVKRAEGEASDQRSKITGLTLEQALAIKNELNFPNPHAAREHMPPVWQECEVVAQFFVGKRGGFVYIPVDELSSLAAEMNRASDAYFKEKHKPKLKAAGSVVARVAHVNTDDDVELED